MKWSLNLPPAKKKRKNKGWPKGFTIEKPHGLSCQWAQEKPDLERHPGGGAAAGKDPPLLTLLLTVESILLISTLPHFPHVTSFTLENEATMASNSAAHVLHLNS